MENKQQNPDHSPNELFGKVLKSLPEEQLSMTWRSELNNKILAENQRISKRRRFARFVVRPLLGLSLAGAATVGFFMLRPAATPVSKEMSKPSLEASLMRAHQENEVASDLSEGIIVSQELEDGGSG